MASDGTIPDWAIGYGYGYGYGFGDGDGFGDGEIVVLGDRET